MKGRSLRRHHKQRRIQAEFKKWNRISLSEDDAMQIARRDIRTPCSCYMCGSPRRWCKAQTIQESKYDFDTREQLQDVGKFFQPRFRFGY